MKWKKMIALPLVAGLWLLGFLSDSSYSGDIPSTLQDVARAQPEPFSIDPAKSLAYVARDYMSVYFVAEPDVIHATFLLPEAKTPLVQVPVDSGNTNSITLFSGPRIASYVLPQGGQPPFPTGHEYTRKEALRGVVICRDAPLKGRFEYDKKIIVSLYQVDFGDGKLYSVSPTKLTVRAFPP